MKSANGQLNSLDLSRFNQLEFKSAFKDREFFKNEKIIEKKKGHRCHLVRCEGMKEDAYYKVGKQFYKEVTL